MKRDRTTRRGRRSWTTLAGVMVACWLVGGIAVWIDRSRTEVEPVVTQEDIPDRFTELFLMEEPAGARERALQSSGLAAVLATSGGGSAIADSMATDRQHEAYDHVTANDFRTVADEALSTFSIDVDTASYANVRSMLTGGSMPPAGAVRIEEMLNYFAYDYAPPTGSDPFATHVEVAGCPWAPEHRLARVGIKGWEIANEDRPVSNLVFLLDVSGSMNSPNKLPLLKQAMGMLVDQLGENDRVAIVVYAGASGLVLDSTSCDDREAVLDALRRLNAGGSTNGGAGIQLAYDTAMANFVEGGVNRVILATDGDFNVGTTSQSDLVDMVEDKARSGVFLTVLGFGMGNYQDSTLEKLADKGNGNYAYIDTEMEAKKVLVEQIGGTLVTIAKDVKIQVEFNPAEVGHYRLIGYENRLLAAQDFNDDTKDAGEIGAGHTVTALYEIVPAGVALEVPGVDPLKYQQAPTLSPAAGTGELFTLKLRYKQPDGNTSKLLTIPVRDSRGSYARASTDFQFAASVAAFGMLLRDSPYKGTATYDSVLELGGEGARRDPHGYRAEFLQLVRTARQLDR
jgi:Ca-activated chloride channel homolog